MPRSFRPKAKPRQDVDSSWDHSFGDVQGGTSHSSQPALPPRRRRKNETVPKSGKATKGPKRSASGQRASSSAETPPWAYVFMVACVCIMIPTRGGAIWGALGGAVGGICVKVAQSTDLPVSARISICTVITGVLWGMIIGLVNAVAG
ncbi:MAG: hypothetical protein R3C59_25245 [Planctomycetaceae bacterium]